MNAEAYGVAGAEHSSVFGERLARPLFFLAVVLASSPFAIGFVTHRRTGIPVC